MYHYLLSGTDCHKLDTNQKHYLTFLLWKWTTLVLIRVVFTINNCQIYMVSQNKVLYVCFFPICICKHKVLVWDTLYLTVFYFRISSDICLYSWDDEFDSTWMYSKGLFTNYVIIFWRVLDHIHSQSHYHHFLAYHIGPHS